MHSFIKFICIPVMVLGLVFQAVQIEAKDRQINDLERNLSISKYKVEATERTLQLTQALQKELASRDAVQTVTVTAYNPTENQCDADPLIAASMRKVKPGTIAVSRDLFDQGWVFGKKVRIEGLGIFEINDLMNKRFTKAVDVFMWDHKEALAFGKKDIKVALLDI